MAHNPIVETFKEHIGKVITTSPSPFTGWLKPVLLEVEEGRLTVEILIRHDMLNPAGTLHGGIAAAILDDIVGATVYTLNSGKFFTTVNNVIDYFANSKLDDSVIAKTQVIKNGNQIVNAQCELFRKSDGKMIARGYSNLMKIG
jgi:acyl-coenzyme A thioesterase 13